MPSLIYDAPVIYDTPYYTYDGFPALDTWFDLKTAIDRELRFGSVLDGLVSAERIDMDMRMYYSREALPFVSFERVIAFEDNQIRMGRERFAFHVCCERGEEDEADAIMDALRDACAGTKRQWGSFDGDGNPLPYYGPLVKTIVASASEGREEDVTRRTLQVVFTYIRP